MTRLPSAMQPAWPFVKRLHRTASLLCGFVVRRTSRLGGARALPRTGLPSSALTAAREPSAVTMHSLEQGEHVRRPSPTGDPAGHWVFERKRDVDVPPRYSLEIRGGTVVGDYGATMTPGGVLDYETSSYFGVSGWREHPIFLRARLPRIDHVEGTLVVLATRGGSNNYYHFLLDVLPRWGVFEQTMPGRDADAIYVPYATRYQRELLELAGLHDIPRVTAAKHAACQADRLVVPCIPNVGEAAPPATVAWLRSRLPAETLEDKPRRIYVTRGDTPNSRRLIREAELMGELSRRGFVRLDPGSMSVRDQIDHFAAAEVIVAPHGAALANLVFASPGVRILELFTAEYVNGGYWSIADSIPDACYRYLMGGHVERHGPDSPMNRIQADIDIDPDRIIDAVDRLLRE